MARNIKEVSNGELETQMVEVRDLSRETMVKEAFAEGMKLVLEAENGN